MGSLAICRWPGWMVVHRELTICPQSAFHRFFRVLDRIAAPGRLGDKPLAERRRLTDLPGSAPLYPRHRTAKRARRAVRLEPRQFRETPCDADSPCIAFCQPDRFRADGVREFRS